MAPRNRRTPRSRSARSRFVARSAACRRPASVVTRSPKGEADAPKRRGLRCQHGASVGRDPRPGRSLFCSHALPTRNVLRGPDSRRQPLGVAADRRGSGLRAPRRGYDTVGGFSAALQQPSKPQPFAPSPSSMGWGFVANARKRRRKNRRGGAAKGTEAELTDAGGAVRDLRQRRGTRAVQFFKAARNGGDVSDEVGAGGSHDMNFCAGQAACPSLWSRKRGRA